MKQLRDVKRELKEVCSFTYVGDGAAPDVAAVLDAVYEKLTVGVCCRIDDALNGLGQDGDK